jgi:hypothetical protein
VEFGQKCSAQFTVEFLSSGFAHQRIRYNENFMSVLSPSDKSHDNVLIGQQVDPSKSFQVHQTLCTKSGDSNGAGTYLGNKSAPSR